MNFMHNIFLITKMLLINIFEEVIVFYYFLKYIVVNVQIGYNKGVI